MGYNAAGWMADMKERLDNTSKAPVDRQTPAVNNHSAPEAKIALFRSLFRGRDDVYPRRFESPCGCSGANTCGRLNSDGQRTDAIPVEKCGRRDDRRQLRTSSAVTQALSEGFVGRQRDVALGAHEFDDDGRDSAIR